MTALCLALLFGLGAAFAAAAEQEARPANAAAAPAEYEIGPGDVLQIFVWKEPDLTREVTVRVDGKLTLPLVGDLDAAGRTPTECGAEIGKQLARFVATPQVTVGVYQANSNRFYIVGLVAKSGEYPLGGQTTFLQALALAGGFQQFANTDNIVIIRQQAGKQVSITVSYKKLEGGKDLAQNVTLRRGDTIVVP